MNWYLALTSVIAAVMLFIAGVMFILYAREFFFHTIPSEWYIIGVSFIFIGGILAADHFYTNIMVENVLATLLAVGSLFVLLGFMEAYRKATGGF